MIPSCSMVCFDIDYYVLTDNSVLVSNTTLIEGSIACVSNCKDSNLHCGIDFLKIMENTFKDSFVFITAAMADYAITIEDSDILSGGISYSSSKSNNDTTINVIFRNIDIFSSGVNLNGSAALFVNCTFGNNTGISPINFMLWGPKT